MGYKSYEYTPPDCFICGDKPAIMGSTGWLPYEGEACSDKCGLEAKSRIEKWRQSDQYKDIARRLSSAHDDMRIGEMSALDAPTPKEE